MRTPFHIIGVLLLFATAHPAASQANQDTSELRRLADVRIADSSRLNNRVTIHRLDMALDEALHMIGRQAGFSIAFSTDGVGAEGSRDVDLERRPAGSALRELLSNTSLEAYVSSSESIVILPKARRGSRSSADGPTIRQGQTIRGRVVDRATKAPLTGANVVVVDSDPLIGTSTDSNGRFVLEQVPLGRQALRVSYIGYRSVVLPDVMVTSGKEVVLTVELEEQVFRGEEVVVMPEIRNHQPMNDMAIVSARSFSVEETRRYAGGLDDPARMASAFPGVATGAGIQENAVVIRGNAPKGVLWRLEGVEIPNPNHFAGLAVMGAGGLTLFSSQLLASSDFLTSAFPAEYGNALAGVFDMRFRSGNASTREHAFQVGLIGIDVASEGPFVIGKPSTYLFNYRYSTIGLLMPLLPTEDVARFQDLSFKLHFPTRRYGVIDVWGIGGLDGQSASATEDSSDWEYEVWDRLDSELGLGVGAAGVGHTLLLGPQTYVRSSLAGTVNRTVLDQERISDQLTLVDDLSIHNTTGHLILSSYVNHKFSAGLTQRVGFSVDRVFYDYSLRSAAETNGTLVPVAIEHGGSALLRAFTEAQLGLAPGVTAQVGLHAQHFALTRSTSLEPRLSVEWELDQHALTSGYGLHSQTEDLRFYLAEVGIERPNLDLLAEAGIDRPNLDLGFARAHHGVVGYQWRMDGSRRLRIEAYYQYLFDVPVIPDSSYSLLNFRQDWSFRERLSNSGAGRNVGVELAFERFLEDGFYYLVTGSVFESAYRGGDGEWRPTRWDRGFTANALGGKEFTLGTSILGLNARLSALGGLRRSPVDHAASAAQEEVVFDETRAFSERAPALILLDVTLTYRRNHRRTSEVWALQLKNALAAQETSRDYNFQTDRVETVEEGFPLPVLSYKLEF